MRSGRLTQIEHQTTAHVVKCVLGLLTGDQFRFNIRQCGCSSFKSSLFIYLFFLDTCTIIDLLDSVMVAVEFLYLVLKYLSM